MPIRRNKKLASDEELQAFFDDFESMSTVQEDGSLSFPGFLAFNNLEEILPDAFIVKPVLRRSAAIRLFRKALYSVRREGVLTADALIERAEDFYRTDRAKKLSSFAMWTKIRAGHFDENYSFNFKWGEVSISIASHLPKWLQLKSFFKSGLGEIDPSLPMRSGYIILKCRERLADDAVDRMFDALYLLMALMNVYESQGNWTIMSGRNWTAGQLRMGPYQFVFQENTFLENYIWYDPDYDDDAWIEQLPKFEKFRKIVPFVRRCLSKLTDHPLKYILVTSLQLAQNGFEARNGNHRILRFWAALEKLYVEDWARDRSNQKVIERATFADSDARLTRWELGHIARLRNEYVHARGHEDMFMAQSQMLRDLFGRHILHWIYHGRNFDSHDDLLAYVDLPTDDKALMKMQRLIARRIKLNK